MPPITLLLTLLTFVCLSNSQSRDNYDFIVVGSGPAGAIVATRLAQSGWSVLLLDQGTNRSVDEELTKSLARLHANDMWKTPSLTRTIHTTSQPSFGGRRITTLQPRGYGGAFSASSGVLSVPNFGEYAEWNMPTLYTNAALTSWVNKIKAHTPFRSGTTLPKPKLTDNFLTGAQAAFPAVITNSQTAIDGTRTSGTSGVGYFSFATNTGSRTSPLPGTFTFIGEDLLRSAPSNLEIKLGARVTKITMQAAHPGTAATETTAATSATPPKATGVLLDGQVERTSLTVNKEVILAGGTYGTTQLALLSGIGPRADLEALGIPVFVDSPNLGKNYFERLNFPIAVTGVPDTTPPPVPSNLDPATAALLNPILFAQAISDYRAGLGGVLTQPVVGADAFGSSVGSPIPDFFIEHVTTIDNIFSYPLESFGLICLPKINSRGTIKLRSPNPNDVPLIDPNFFSDPFDAYRTIHCAAVALQIMNNPSFDASRGAYMSVPSPYNTQCSGLPLSPDCLTHLGQITAVASNTAYHNGGTLKMGPDSDTTRVTNPDFKVVNTLSSSRSQRLVAGLRVVDSSVLPTLLTANAGMVVAINAERAAEVLIAEYGTKP